MKPYYQHAGVTIYHGDCREILPQLDPVDVIITDPVWPNSLPALQGADRPLALFREAMVFAPRLTKRLVVHLGCQSDPRFLISVPTLFPFFRTCWLPYVFKNYVGRVLKTSDVAYAFGEAPKSRPGRHVIPGEKTVNIELESRNAQPTGKAGRGHPCPRNLAHVEWLIKWFADGTVLDPFAGAGTALLAAKRANLPAVGIEIEEKYCEIAAKRLGQEVFDFSAVVKP